MRVIVKVQLGSLTLRNSELERLEVVQALGEHTRLEASFIRDQMTDLLLDDLLGAPAQVTLQNGDDAESEPIVIFEGAVSEGTQQHHMHYGSQFRIEAVSASVKLEYANTAYFKESTIGDVVGMLGADLNGSPRSSVPLDFVQHGETDFEFLLRLADEGGLFVRTDGPRVEVRSTFGDATHPLLWGDTLLSIAANSRPTNHGNKGAFFHMEEKRDHRFHGIREDAKRLGGAASLVAAANALAAKTSGGGDPLLEETPWRSRKLGEYREALARESARASGSNVTLRGESVQLTLRAGDAIEIAATGTFKPPTLGRFGLVRVTHFFDGQTYSNRFDATTWDGYSLPVRPPRRVMPGPVTAEVIENEDPKQMGRVKVRYRWMKLDQETRWLRIVTPYTGNERGVHFTPEIGDEVMIAFEQGDPERAYVIGSIWNGKDLAPQKTGFKRIITRSGNTIEMADEPGGKEHIEIYSPEGKCWIQLATEHAGDPHITIHSEGNLALEAVGEVRITSNTFVLETEGDSIHKIGGKATFDAKGETVVKSGMNLGLQAGLNATLKGGVNTNVIGGAITNVVGGMVHIQPPGFVAPAISPDAPPSVQSAWGERPVPTPSKGKSTTDSPTPRSD